MNRVPRTARGQQASASRRGGCHGPVRCPDAPASASIATRASTRAALDDRLDDLCGALAHLAAHPAQHAAWVQRQPEHILIGALRDPGAFYRELQGAYAAVSDIATPEMWAARGRRVRYEAQGDGTCAVAYGFRLTGPDGEFFAYDIDQTEPAEPPADPDPALTARYEAFVAVAGRRGVPVLRGNRAMSAHPLGGAVNRALLCSNPSGVLLGRRRARCDADGNAPAPELVIGLAKCLDPTQRVLVLVHELGHLLCQYDPAAPVGAGQFSTSEREAQAETVAYLVCAQLSMDVSDCAHKLIEFTRGENPVELIARHRALTLAVAGRLLADSGEGGESGQAVGEKRRKCGQARG